MNVSPKRLALLQSTQEIKIAQMVESGERYTGKGINQIGAVQRACKTRWSSHFESICSIIDMFGSVIVILQSILVDEKSPNSIRGELAGCLSAMRSFDFVFILHLMQKITEITNLLCKIVQTKALDILNAMEAVESTKVLLQSLRNESFDVLLYIVESCCMKRNIEMPCMKDSYKSATGRASQQKDFITVEHHYRVDVFNVVIHFQVEEISGRFNDKAVELLKLSSTLEARDNFKSFNPDDICALAKKYNSGDFSEQDMHYLKVQLEHYKHNVVEQEKFHGLSTISEWRMKLVETNKSVHYNLIDRLIRLVLTLPVSTATTERAFSVMKIVKSVLRNKMNEDFLADSLVINIERQLAKDIDVDTVINEFDSRKNRKNISVSSRYHNVFTVERLPPSPRNSHNQLLADLGDNRVNHWAVIQSYGIFTTVVASLNVYGVPVKANQISETTVTLSMGNDGPREQIDAIQFGWHVWPAHYGDNDTHFFVYWTNNGFLSGCLNLDCEGFIFDKQSLYRPGNKLKPVSERNGKQYYITVRIIKQPTGRWHLYYGSGWDKQIGSWDVLLFNSMWDYGTRVEVGGIVEFTRGEPSPPMGSGIRPSDPNGKAAMIRVLDRYDAPIRGSIHVDRGDCYSLARSNGDFYYGGPGGCTD